MQVAKGRKAWFCSGINRSSAMNSACERVLSRYCLVDDSNSALARCTSLWIAIAAITAPAQSHAQVVKPGARITVIITSSGFSDPADLAEGETLGYLLVVSSGGFTTTLPCINGAQLVAFRATVVGETVSVTYVADANPLNDGDEGGLISYQVSVSNNPPDPPPPTPPPPPKPAPPAPPPPPPPPPLLPPPDPLVVPDANKGPPNSCAMKAGDPINVGTGSVYDESVDYSGGGSYPFEWTRYYNSSPWSAVSGWSYNYDFKAKFVATPQAFNLAQVVITRPDGGGFNYVLTALDKATGATTWSSAQDLNGRLVGRATLTYDGNGVITAINRVDFSYTDAGNVTYNFSGSGSDSIDYVSSIVYPSGYSLQFTSTRFPSSDFLSASSIVDSFGRTFSISFETNSGAKANMPKSVTFPDGQVLNYTNIQNGTGWLIYQVAYADYQFPTTYIYSSSAPYVLTDIYDQNGQIYDHYDYDTQGRAFFNVLGGGLAGATTLVYNTTGPTQVTDPAGTRLHAIDKTTGVMRSAGVNQPAGSGCSQSTSVSTYDASGALSSSDDFNGHRTCYVRDAARHLELSRVEGLSNSAQCSLVTSATATLPVGSRKVSTSWHPNWRLPIQTAEPLKITNYFYNGQTDPQTATTASCVTPIYGLPTTLPLAGSITQVPLAVLCTRIEQATTDGDGSKGAAASPQGSPRIWNYTYNELGQVLTATDPLGNVTSYDYYLGSDPTRGLPDYTKGDLSTIADAAGKRIQFASYDGAGRLRSYIDPNGTLVENFYYRAGLLYSRRVTPAGDLARTTQYDYYPTRQLKQVTLPNGTVLSYTYDAAHRLTQIADSAGNQIVYTLDGLGNRIGEQVTDPGGSLARNITRSYDALRRLQSSTGAPR